MKKKARGPGKWSWPPAARPSVRLYTQFMMGIAATLSPVQRACFRSSSALPRRSDRLTATARPSLLRGSVRPMAAAKPDVWALDFDGVACDSCGESSLSAWKVRELPAAERWCAHQPLPCH